jgi:hypothetical protein
MNNCVLFMHSSVKSFIITLGDSILESPVFFDQFSRMPLLEHLDVRHAGHKNVGDKLLEVISGFQSLKTIILPRCQLSARTLEAVSGLPYLVSLQAQEDSGLHSYLAMPSSDSRLSVGAFCSLSVLAFTAGIPSATQLLNQRFSTQLKGLCIDLPEVELPCAVRSLLEVVVDRCRDVERFTLTSCHSKDRTGGIVSHIITFETLEPILYCPRLKSLKILHDLPLSLTMTELELLASRLTSIESLHLNESPAREPGKPALPLDALLIFARHCPKLESLGLLINASQGGEISTNNVRAFVALQTLSLGYSTIGEVNPVAVFLGEICPPGCKISIMAPAYPGKDKWRKVSEVLPMLVAMRINQEARMKKPLLKS